MKLIKLGYSLMTYLFFLCVFNYLVLFLGGSFLSEWLPMLAELKNIDSGKAYLAIESLPVWLANVLLLLAFSVHHSVMARSGAKALLIKLIPKSAERSTFVLITCCILAWLFIAWQPQLATVWQIDGVFKTVLMVFFLMGAGLVLWSTFMISHWRLFGLEQAWQEFKGLQPEEESFSTPALYKYSRHPMYVGVLIVLWSTPHMTLGHLIMASVWTLYVFIGIYFEERDLVREFGNKYLAYQASVSKLLPFRAITRLLSRKRRDDANWQQTNTRGNV